MEIKLCFVRFALTDAFVIQLHVLSKASIEKIPSRSVLVTSSKLITVDGKLYQQFLWCNSVVVKMLLFRIIYCHFQRLKFWLLMFPFLIFHGNMLSQTYPCNISVHPFANMENLSRVLNATKIFNRWVLHYTSHDRFENQLKIYDRRFTKPCHEYRLISETILKLFPQCNLNCSSALRSGIIIVNKV